jgi:hypothetical protein
MDEVDRIQQSGAERWRAKQNARKLGLPLEEEPKRSYDPAQESDLTRDNSPDYRPRGLEDDLDF